MTVLSKMQGKLRSLSALMEFRRHLCNGVAVWKAYRASEPLPMLKFRSGVTLAHAPEDDPVSLFREIFVARVYAPAWFYSPSETDRLIDIGANIGSFALFIQVEARGAHVDCYEPAPDARTRLLHNVEANDLRGMVRVYAEAVSRNDGHARMQLCGLSKDRTLSNAGESVATVPLDTAVSRIDRVDYLKIDAEGAEADILEGASPATLSAVRRVAIEYHNQITPDALGRCRRVLERQGFATRVDLHYSPTDTGMLYATRLGSTF
jgi:FkbM family methyltransferase